MEFVAVDSQLRRTHGSIGIARCDEAIADAPNPVEAALKPQSQKIVAGVTELFRECWTVGKVQATDFKRDGEFDEQGHNATAAKVSSLFLDGAPYAQLAGRELAATLFPNCTTVGRDTAHELRLDVKHSLPHGVI